MLLKNLSSRSVPESSQPELSQGEEDQQDEDIEISIAIPPHLQSSADLKSPAPRTGQMPPSSAVGAVRPAPSPSDQGDPPLEKQKNITWGAPNPASRIAELELQLQLKEQEWKALTAQMETQVATFQKGYEERIQYLENRLEEQEDQLQIKLQQEVQLRRMQSEIERLEKGFQEARQESQRARRHLEQALAVREQERAQTATEQADLQAQLEASQAETQALTQKVEAQTLEIQVLRFQINTLEAQVESSGDPSAMAKGGTPHPARLISLAIRMGATPPTDGRTPGSIPGVRNPAASPAPGEASVGRDGGHLSPDHSSPTKYRPATVFGCGCPSKCRPRHTLSTHLTGIPPVFPHIAPRGSPRTCPFDALGSQPFQSIGGIGPDRWGRVERVMHQWQLGGGRLTQVIAQVTNLSPVTIRFFCDGGSVARQAGCRRLGDFLVAAGLVPQEVIKTLRRDGIWESLQQAQALVEQGILPQATVDYFLTQFVEDFSGPTEAPSSAIALLTYDSSLAPHPLLLTPFSFDS
ncbi:MAG: hypothetical protein HC818_02290, partial [Synechococcaceae cyanobacterium RM1_1_27]|nr:hypothetical protein [Synechococcaceae cyanobacterium RM1_1_27]